MLKALRLTLADVASPAFRQTVLKTVLLAVALLTVAGIALHRGLAWLADHGGTWLVARFGEGWAGAAGWFETIAGIVSGLGIVAAAIFLVPPVSAIVASLFLDDVAERVESEHYPNAPKGRALPVLTAIWEAAKFFAVVLAVNLMALPALLLAGLGAIVFFLANAYLLSREFFELNAFRGRGVAEGKAMRRRHAGAIFLAGLPIAALAVVPILNLVTPVFGTTLMAHLYQGLSEKEGKAP
jgi:uncharacterized protein involved in cysteine biosynthesis